MWRRVLVENTGYGLELCNPSSTPLQAQSKTMSDAHMQQSKPNFIFWIPPFQRKVLRFLFQQMLHNQSPCSDVILRLRLDMSNKHFSPAAAGCVSVLPPRSGSSRTLSPTSAARSLKPTLDVSGNEEERVSPLRLDSVSFKGGGRKLCVR